MCVFKGIGIGDCLVALFVLVGPVHCQTPASIVKRNMFTSSDNPAIRIDVDHKLRYVGNFQFRIEHAVSGYLYIFVHAERDKHVERMFVIQQESFLPSSNDTYKYPITNPLRLGKSEYQHSVIFDDNQARIDEEPGKEADLTQRFLAAHKYVTEPEIVMSRFARPIGAERKHEIILFCYENLSSYRHRLADFLNGTNGAEARDIKMKADENCRSSFQIKE